MYSEFNNYGANATPVMMDCSEAPKQLEEMRPNGVIAELRNVDFGSLSQQQAAPVHNVVDMQNVRNVGGVHNIVQPPNMPGVLQQPLQQNGHLHAEIKTDPNSSQPVPTVSARKKTKKKRNESIGWPDKDLCQLFMRMESLLPIDDKLTYKSRIDKMDWNAIAFNNYSGDDCKQMWCNVQKKMRRFRILREILTDAKEWMGMGVQPKRSTKNARVPNKTIKAPPQYLQIQQTPPPQQLIPQQLPQQLLQQMPQQIPRPPPPPPPTPDTNKEKRSHKKKHPDMPNRPLTAYKLFYRDKKDAVMAENPGLDLQALAKLISQLFKTLPPKIKETYEKQSQELHREYESKLAAFYQVHPELAVMKERRSPKTPSSTNNVKRQVTPFALYLAEQSQDDTCTDRKSFRSACKEKWRSLPDKEKMVWIKKVLDEEQKTQQAQQEQQQQQQQQQQDAAEPSTSTSTTPTKHRLTKDEQRIIERASGKPAKPPCSAYSMFTRMMLMSEEIKCIHHQNRLSVISDQWKALSEADKELYRQRCAAITKQYKKDLAQYLDSLPEDKRKEEEEALHAAAQKRQPPGRKKSKLRPSKVNLKRQSSATSEDNPNKPKRVKSENKRVFRAGIRTSMRHKNPIKSESEDDKSEVKKEDGDDADTEKAVKKEKGEEVGGENKDDSTQPDESEEGKKSSSESEDEDKPKEEEEPESELMARFKGQPKKPPPTSYALFCKTYKGQQKRRAAWKRLGHIRRERYELQLQILKREYIAEYAAFLKSLTKEELHEFAKLNLQQKKEENE